MYAFEVLTEGWRDYVAKSLPELYKMLKTALTGSDEFKDISKAIAAKKRQEANIAVKRDELQQVVKGIEQDPEKLALQKQIQTFRGELNKRKRDSISGLEELKKEYEKMDTKVIQDLLRRESRKNGESDFYLWLKDILDTRLAKQELLKSVSGSIKQGTSSGAKAAEDAPWTLMQLKGGRKQFRDILNNPQHPKHAEAKKLWNDYKGTEQ